MLDKEHHAGQGEHYAGQNVCVWGLEDSQALWAAEGKAETPRTPPGYLSHKRRNCLLNLNHRYTWSSVICRENQQSALNRCNK